MWLLDFCNLLIDRRDQLEKKLASSDVPVEEQMNQLKELERKETEYIRLKRHRMNVDDFELLTVIGRGAFGEVFLYYIYTFVSLTSPSMHCFTDVHIILSSHVLIIPYCLSGQIMPW